MPAVSSSPSPSPSLDRAITPNAYTYVPDGHGGIKYFLNGQPITNTQYRAGTGKNTDQIEAQAAQQYGTTNTMATTDPGGSNAAGQYGPNQVTQGAPPTGTGGVTSYGNVPKFQAGLPVTYLGQTYDLNDPDQRQQYYQAVDQNVGAQRDQQLSGLDRSIQESTGQLNQGISNTNQGAGNYARTFLENLFDLGQNHDVGQVNNSQKFAGLGPNAFQSSQATTGDYGDQQYNRGLNDLGTQLQQSVGGDYLNGGAIDPNSGFGQQLTGYNQQLGDLSYQGGQQRQNINNAYHQALDQASSGLQVSDVYQGMNPFKYNTQTYNPYQSSNLNLGQYTPYTNYQQYANSPQNNQNPSQPNNQNGNPLAGILGFNPSQSQSNYYNAFVNRSPQAPPSQS